MKTTSYFFSLMLILMSSIVLAQSSSRVKISKALEYNDYIVEAQNKIGKSLLDLMAIVNTAESTHEQAKASLQVLNNTIDLSINTLENLEEYSPDYGLRKSALDLFRFYQRTMRNQYVILTDEIYSDNPNVELLDKTMAQISQEEKTYDDAFQSAQEQFARANNFVLEQNSMQEQIQDKTE
jgi:hypothetical protein